MTLPSSLNMLTSSMAWMGWVFIFLSVAWSFLSSAPEALDTLFVLRRGVPLPLNCVSVHSSFQALVLSGGRRSKLRWAAGLISDLDEDVKSIRAKSSMPSNAGEAGSRNVRTLFTSTHVSIQLLQSSQKSQVFSAHALQCHSKLPILICVAANSPNTAISKLLNPPTTANKKRNPTYQFSHSPAT